jgi:hypothetical protein
MAEMRAGPPRISCAFPVFDVGKPHGMGSCAHVALEIETLSTEMSKFSDRVCGFSVGKRLIKFPAAVITFWERPLTL